MHKLISFLKSRDGITLLILFGIGLLLRLYNHTDNFIFGYDQARDAQRVYDIVHDFDIKLVGPESDIPGIFHGVLFYYLITPIYALSRFDPNTVVVFLSILNSLGIFLIYSFGKLLFNKKVGFIAAFFWAVSYEQISYSRFISNPTLMSLTTALFFFGIALYLFKKKEYGLIVSAVGYALSVHLNFFLIYLIIFYPLIFVIYKSKLKMKTVVLSIGTILFIISPFIFAEIKFQFAGVHGLLKFMNHQSTPTSIFQSMEKYIDKLAGNVYYSFFSFNHILAFFLLLFFIFITHKYEKKQTKELQFLIIIVFSTLPLFAFDSGVHNSVWINASLFTGLSILFALGIMILSELYSRWLIFASMILVLASNCSLMIKDKFENVQLFAVQRILYRDIKNAVDYTFESSKGQPFSVCGITNPLFVNTTWSYLYGNYGKNRYGKIPTWAGQPQFLNKNLMEYDKTHEKIRYIIIEPLGSIPILAKQATIFSEDHISDLVESKEFGWVTVQKRVLHPKKEYTDTQSLKPDEALLVERLPEFEPRYTCFMGY